MRTTPPATPNPFTWRRFANVQMGDYLLGEDTVDLAELGFCGERSPSLAPPAERFSGMSPWNSSAMGLKTPPQPTSPPRSIGTTRSTIRALHKPPPQNPRRNHHEQHSHHDVTAIDSKKPTTKQELIAANIKLLIEQLEAGQSDALTNYLTAMSRFHNYSFGNVLEIARQMPTATRVAGFWTWKNLGRSVNAGAKGIRILAPIVGVRRKKDEEAEKDITKQNERVLLGFRNAYVFDVSQTNGVDLPDHARSQRRPRREHRPSGRIPQRHRASSLSTTRRLRPRSA